MRWFGSKQRARVTADGATAIRVTEPNGRQTVVDIATLDWLALLQVGDDTTMTYEGWWLLGRPEGALAIAVDCGAIDPLLRDGPLTAVANLVDDKTLLFRADRPSALRDRDARDGIVHLDGTAATDLRRSASRQAVSSVSEFPTIL
jgi:hypothetical protein